jgi:tetratricopeptide (TPR) repeat protein
MPNNWELMLMYSDEELAIEDALKVEKTINEDKDLKRGYLLNRQINEYMQIQLMMEQIKADPDLDEIENSLKSEVVESQSIPENSNSGLLFYINGALTDIKNVENQVDDAEREMYLKGIDEETNLWVQTWKEEMSKMEIKDKYTLEIADFIKKGMNSTKSPIILNTNKQTKRKLFFRISAVAAIIILALGFWSIFGSNPTTDDLFAEYYKPYDVIDGQTRSYKQTNDKFIEIARLYENGQYNDAAQQLDEMIAKDNNSPKILLIYGITQIEQHKYQNAISSFNEIIKDDGEFSIEAKWYVALCYLKVKDTKKAKALMMELSKTPGFYMAKAQKILGEI